MQGKVWPFYSSDCIADVSALLKRGGSLSAYRANPSFGIEPARESWAFRLERLIEQEFKVKHAIAVNSGTAALHAALGSLDLRGGEVVTSPYTFSATASAIVLAGGTPVFSDVDPKTFSITKETVKRVVTKKTKAILPVHLFGGLADVRGLMEFGLPIIEDACQAVGAKWVFNDRHQEAYSGTLGGAGAYSFNGGKNVPAGEGGALVTNSDRIAEKARLFMNHGESFYKDSIGYNYRINEITACVAYHGVKVVKARNRRRQELVRVFNEISASNPTITCTSDDPEESSVWYVYPFTLARDINRKRFVQACQARKLAVTGGYVTPSLEKYPAFRRFAKSSLPAVTELSEKTLCLISSFTPDRPASHGKNVAREIARVCDEML